MKNLKQSGLSLYAHLIRWDTEDEINFLEGLSGWRSFGCRAIDPERRKMLLLGYREGIKLRSKWEAIEKDKVIQYLEKALKEAGK